MNLPTPEQKLKIGLYVGILVLIIIAIWYYFFREQLTRSLKQANDSTFEELGVKLSDLFDDEEKNFNKIQESITNLANSSGQVSNELANQFALEVENKLWAKRTTDWNIWENDLLGFKYPADWEVIQSENSLFIRDMPNAYKPYKIEINFFDNPNGLTAAEWWNDLSKSAQEPDYTTLSEELNFGDHLALSKTTDNHPDLPDQYSRLIFIPVEGQIIQVALSTDLKEFSQNKQIFDDFVKTIFIK